MFSKPKPINPENSNLATVLQRGDRRILKAFRKAIVLLGLTRNGKSTTFNWILKRPMKGKASVLNSEYLNIVEDSQTAKVGSSYSSVTLAPNVHVQFENDVSLIDAAGWQDTRDYIAVFGVSYFLKTLFQKVRQVKFVIVFDQIQFQQSNGQGLLKTFNGFLSMFHYHQMSAKSKQNLKDSISVVITKSKKPQDHFAYFDEVINQFSNQALSVTDRDEVIDLMQSIRSSARIQPFKAATDNGNPQECSFINRFTENKGWKYFDLDQAERDLGKNPISLPFQADFNKLTEPERNAFTNYIIQRVESHIAFTDILGTLMNNFTQNWTQFLQVWRTQRKIIPNHFQMKPTFDKIREYVKANDIFDEKQSMEVKVRVNYEPLTLISSIKKLLSIFDHVLKVGTSQHFEDFLSTMAEIDCKFSAIIQCLRSFASENSEDVLLTRLQYILSRGFREFSKLYQLKPGQVQRVKNDLQDRCNIAFDIKKSKLIELFVAQFTSDLLVRLFPTFEILSEYEQFFRAYEQECKEGLQQSPPAIFFSQRRCFIQTAQADLFLSASQKIKALKFYIKTLKSLSDISVCVAEDEHMESPIKEAQLKSLSMSKIKMVRKIVNILKFIPENERVNYKKYALWLCQHHKMIEDTFQTYQCMIDSSTNIQDKLKIYADFAQDCAKWGRIEKALEMLQKKLILEEQNFEDYSNTYSAMNKMASASQDYMHKFKALTSETKRLPERDNELNDQLVEIESFLDKQ